MTELIHSWNRTPYIQLDAVMFEKICRQRKCSTYIVNIVNTLCSYQTLF